MRGMNLPAHCRAAPLKVLEACRGPCLPGGDGSHRRVLVGTLVAGDRKPNRGGRGAIVRGSARHPGPRLPVPVLAPPPSILLRGGLVWPRGCGCPASPSPRPLSQ